VFRELWNKVFPKSEHFTRLGIRAGYDMAGRNRLLDNFQQAIKTFNEELRSAPLPTLRARSRELARNNHNAIKFLSLLQKNIVGPEGITLQPKVMLQRGNKPNKALNDAIRDGWKDWGKKPNCTIAKRFTWIQVQKLCVYKVAVDGEAFIRKLVRKDNPHYFTTQFIDPDQVDFNYNEILRNGNRVIMGIEYNQDGAVVNYHVWDRPEGDSYQRRIRIAIPADQIIHLLVVKDPFQARGVPWMVGAALQMHMFKGYQEAELTAAQVAACQMGLIKKDVDPNAQTDPNEKKESDGAGGVPIDIQPGTFAALGIGEEMQMFDPKHPVAAYEAFSKACLRSIAAGLDVSYMSLSGDLEGANYSSARVGLLDERDTWADLQTWLIEELCEPIYQAWLFQSLFSYMKGVPMSVMDYEPCWHPRSFPWVDPQKDAEAAIARINNRLSTRTQELAAQGLDYKEVIDQVADEEDYARQKGVELSVAPAQSAPAAAEEPPAQPQKPNKPVEPDTNSKARLLVI